MAKKRFTKSALWNDQTTDHPQQKRTSFPFKRSGRTDVWPLPAERLQQAAFKPLREKSPYPRSTRQAFKPLFHDASENCRRRRLREEADFAGGGIRNHSKLLRDESHREAVAFFSEDSFVFKLF